MNLKFKIFLSILATNLGLAAFFGLLTFQDSKARLEREFFSRYESIATLAGDTLVQMEKNSKNLSVAAAQYLYLVESQRGLPTNDELKLLAQKLRVSQLCITDSTGNFLRDTESKPEEQNKSLFDFCDDYRNLLNGKSHIESTPIIPSFPYKGPFKFTMIPNHNRTRILEVGIKLDFIAEVLTSALSSDKNLLELRLFAPNGFNLGSIDRSGKVWSGDNVDASLYKEKVGHWINEKDIFYFVSKVPAPIGECCECKVKNVLGEDGQYYYTLVTAVSAKPLMQSINSQKIKIISMCVVALVIALVLAHLLAGFAVKKIKIINDGVNKIMASNNLSLRLGISGSDEAASLAKSFDKMIESLEEQQKKLISSEKEKAFATISSQVAHDIRSPVAALDVVVKDLGGLPEVQRNIMRSALARIKDIANDLIEKNRAISNPKQSIDINGGGDFEVALLSSLVDSLVSEKRIQYRSKVGIDISFLMSEEAYGIFSQVHIAHFQRMLSNLINNSVEALAEGGHISIHLYSEGPWALLEIKDDGLGIDPETLKKIGQRGVTSGKSEGSGLGLHHAITQVESWGGQLELVSELEKGTTIAIKLKLAPSPEWFVKKIEIHPGMNLIVVDDDIAIHNIWKSRMTPFIEQITMSHFTDLKQFSDWFRGARNDNADRNFLTLIDYEFLGSSENGLDTIQKLGIEGASILVTSRFEETKVKGTCKALKVGCIPKGLAGFVPIVLQELRRMDLMDPVHAILIDDDLWMRECWKLLGEQHGKNILTYSSPDEFMKDLDVLGRSLPIFIDMYLGRNDIDGVDLGTMLHNLGFKKLYLSTGALESQFEGISWVKGVVNKEPPDWLWES